MHIKKNFFLKSGSRFTEVQIRTYKKSEKRFESCHCKIVFLNVEKGTRIFLDFL